MKNNNNNKQQHKNSSVASVLDILFNGRIVYRLSSFIILQSWSACTETLMPHF